jgi:hypothetical protein
VPDANDGFVNWLARLPLESSPYYFGFCSTRSELLHEAAGMLNLNFLVVLCFWCGWIAIGFKNDPLHADAGMSGGP